uniref:Uncharacterized protein n=1 Tax=Glossina pallidipes TaxID=7398 RepID=A0A1B0AJK6_GLOPL
MADVSTASDGLHEGFGSCGGHGSRNSKLTFMARHCGNKFNETAHSPLRGNWQAHLAPLATPPPTVQLEPWRILLRRCFSKLRNCETSCHYTQRCISSPATSWHIRQTLAITLLRKDTIWKLIDRFTMITYSKDAFVCYVHDLVANYEVYNGRESNKQRKVVVYTPLTKSSSKEDDEEEEEEEEEKEEQQQHYQEMMLTTFSETKR